MEKFAGIVVDLVVELVKRLMKHDRHLRERQAVSIIFASETYRRLIDERSMLYMQHTDYLFILLLKELRPNGNFC